MNTDNMKKQIYTYIYIYIYIQTERTENKYTHIYFSVSTFGFITYE